MSVYGTSPIKRTRRSRAEIEALDTALIEIVEEFNPVTVRQVFYQAVNRGLVPKSETKGYRVVQRRLVALRASWEVPHGAIVDGTRYVHGHRRYNDLDEFTTYAAGLYRKDYWANSEVNVEVWLEKDALKGVLVPTVVDECGLGLHVTRGFASITYLQEAAEQIEADGRPTHVYVLTDFDPSGVSIAEKVEEDTEEAFEKRRQLVKLLVAGITAGRDEDGQLDVRITYRFGPPEHTHQEDMFVGGVQSFSRCTAVSLPSFSFPIEEEMMCLRPSCS
jgi:hypothetical protein